MSSESDPTQSAVATHPKEAWEMQRDHHKLAGDTAFRCGGFRTAIDEYTKAIDLDPEFWVAYSNRSAAYLKNSEKSKALKDAQFLVQRQPEFVKGHSRLAASLHALRRYETAKDAYIKVLELDASNAVAKQGVEDCEQELKTIAKGVQEAEEEEGKKRQEEEANSGNNNDKNNGEQVEKQSSTRDNDKEDADDDGDDLLNDFFADVEEVTTKKTQDDEQPQPTNKVKHDKQTLGASQVQMERLLKPNFEWRNLNPFYVLQLPHDASEEDISKRYKALSLMLHPDKNGGKEEAQLAFDQVKRAKTLLMDRDRNKHARMLVEEGMTQGEAIYRKRKQQSKDDSLSLEEAQDKEIMRIFAQVEQKRRLVEERERKFQQREQQQEDEQLERERKGRQFDKSWRQEERVGKRVGNWRDFAKSKRKKQG